MKKALALVFALLITMGAKAQLNVIMEIEDTWEKITQRLYFDSQDSTYFLRLTTSNQFDKAVYFSIGNRTQAILTLKQLLDIMENGEKGDMIIVKDDKFNTEMAISKYNKNNLMVMPKNSAGTTFLQRPNVTNWWDIISKRE